MSSLNHDAFAEYIGIELDLGFTFASMATTACSEERFSRNREHVRRVCQTVRHFMPHVAQHRRVKFLDALDGLEDRLRILDSQH